jgi:ribosomal protein L11 methyltransferase
MPTRKTDSWIIIAVRVSPPAAEAVSAYLLEASPAGIEQVDDSHPAPPPDLPADRIEIRAYFPPGTEPSGQVEALQRFCRHAETCVEGFACDPPRTFPLSPEDWADGWKKHFRPVRVGRFFIHPGWIKPDEKETNPVRIDPSLAFGTGLHPTTQLCLKEMDRLLPAKSFLDVGTGSGILALAAARCGVPQVVALDNDPEACRVAQENLEKNGMLGKVEIVEGEIARVPGSFDLVAANILSGTLIPMAAALAERLTPEGVLLLSGLLNDEVDEVIAAYRAAGCRHVSTLEDGEWILVRMTRLAAPEEDA